MRFYVALPDRVKPCDKNFADVSSGECGDSGAEDGVKDAHVLLKEKRKAKVYFLYTLVHLYTILVHILLHVCTHHVTCSYLCTFVYTSVCVVAHMFV